MRCVAILLLIWMGPAMVSAIAIADEPSDPESGNVDARRQWVYEVPAGTRRMIRQDEERWTLFFPNGTTNPMTQLGVTDDYVELRNDNNGNVMRLFADHAVIRAADKSQFRPMTQGKWLAVDPAGQGRVPDYKIELVYFVPSDRTPTANYDGKLRAIASLMEQTVTNDLRSKGYETEGPRFTRDDAGQIKITLVSGDRPALFYNQNAAWKSPGHFAAIQKELQNRSYDFRRQMTFIFSETYEFGPAPRLWPGHIAIATALPPSGGVALFSAWVLQDELATADGDELRRRFFDDSTPYAGRRSLDQENANRFANASSRADLLEDGVGGRDPRTRPPVWTDASFPWQSQPYHGAGISPHAMERRAEKEPAVASGVLRRKC